MNTNLSRDDWTLVNQRLVAKAIAELSYEEILTPSRGADDAYTLDFSNGVTYRFQAWRTVWDYLRINPSTLCRTPASERGIQADRFYLDAKEQLGMSDTTLANFLEELYRTQYSDLQTLKRQRECEGKDLLSLSDAMLQSLLDGHPKALVNKGRIGWSASDLHSFAPESAEPFQLHWLAVARDRVTEQFADGLDAEARLLGSMSGSEARRLLLSLEAKGLDFDRYSLIPVHPWQWNEVIAFHFIDDIQTGKIVSLGLYGDFYQPQTSLRTLSNQGEPKRFHIKLPVSILNTSCIRGIEGKYIVVSPKLTEALRTICAKDAVLSHVTILGDVSGSFYRHESYTSLPEAPYRYKEFLGAIWRESPESLIGDDESTVLTGALFHKDMAGKSLLAMIIERSGLSIGDWLESYFETILVPLYHLQLKYGVGLVSHGQNIVLGMKNFRPSRLMIKDFQGDLRLLDKDIPELEAFAPELKAILTRLPAPYLIHGLLTGHLVTVLRFVSAVLYEDQGYPEAKFYAILSKVIQSHHKTQASYADRIEALGFLSPTIPRVLVNKVRFHIGYGDSAQRPVPMVGTPLNNPLYEDLHGQHA